VRSDYRGDPAVQGRMFQGGYSDEEQASHWHYCGDDRCDGSRRAARARQIRWRWWWTWWRLRRWWWLRWRNAWGRLRRRLRRWDARRRLRRRLRRHARRRFCRRHAWWRLGRWCQVWGCAICCPCGHDTRLCREGLGRKGLGRETLCRSGSLRPAVGRRMGLARSRLPAQGFLGLRGALHCRWLLWRRLLWRLLAPDMDGLWMAVGQCVRRYLVLSRFRKSVLRFSRATNVGRLRGEPATKQKPEPRRGVVAIATG